MHLNISAGEGNICHRTQSSRQSAADLSLKLSPSVPEVCAAGMLPGLMRNRASLLVVHKFKTSNGPRDSTEQAGASD